VQKTPSTWRYPEGGKEVRGFVPVVLRRLLRLSISPPLVTCGLARGHDYESDFASTILLPSYVVIGVVLIEMVMWVMTRLDGQPVSGTVSAIRPTFHSCGGRHLR